ncbi:MAG: hypothetical protein KBT77_15335 [Thalassolituus oleivorans]|uniref:hypothetical protein n=1 Tax=Thalassolituus oleivorans TaxID=187493 RepID=UPI001B62F435|nr:hypothetical protein [Thalassolituus oleivorans]MBQ0728716.1 hypothetical protein [Thalassolituus oleivorans]
MKLPAYSVFRTSRTAMQVGHANLYEIFLFRTRLRFRCPKGDAQLSPSLSGEIGIDRRPYINTESRSSYLREDSINLYFDTILDTGWNLYPKGWFKKPAATLLLSISVNAINPPDRNSYNDLMIPAEAEKWVRAQLAKNISQSQNATFTSYGDYVELNFSDGRLALPDRSEEVDLNIEEVNGHTIFNYSPSANRLTYYTAFGREDMLTFSFSIKSIVDSDNTQKIELIEKANELVSAIIHSISIEVDYRKSPSM